MPVTTKPDTALKTDLLFIEQEEENKLAENEAFRFYTRQFDDAFIDEQVFQIAEEVTQQVDCTSCGNCCRSLMINVEEPELDRIANHLQVDKQLLKQEKIETSEQGKMVMNSIPCAFLTGNLCSVYEHRFSECREFPHLHKPGFTSRMFVTLMHYGRCPIIYNVIEILKNKLNFHISSKD
ncbi:YkgJ family cysteine cluster protein [Aridibaculum aurantiacum]|uniref:YkgJ family cysteine cluster protein n=1 Tax=Aridibaculum aurantiacum TaxID=2810307 RepID=UPI001A963860|nr:YkgJ family cysteine cluster protein [Aridibaculum aurantiacum]